MKKTDKLEHYSPKQGLKEIDPKFKRTGVDQTSRSNQLSHDISFFYPKGTTPEHVVLQPAKSKYTVKLSQDHNVFDAAKHGKEHIEAVKEANGGAFNLDHFITRLKDHGFHGFKTTPQGIPMVALFDSAKIHSEEPVQKSLHSPSKHIGLKRLKQIKRDHNIGAGGKEYSEEELHHEIGQRQNSLAQKQVKQFGTEERKKAKDAQNPKGGSLPPPFKKSENDLQKGLRGDWQKEGYTLHHKAKHRTMDGVGGKKITTTNHEVVARDKHKNLIGTYQFDEHHTGKHKGQVHVYWAHTEDPHKRKGLASSAYQMIEQKTNKKITDNPKERNVSSNALWNQKNRPFGKNEDKMSDLKKSKNAKEQKEKAWGRTSQPSAKSPMREKHMEHIKDFAQRRYGLGMKPSGGKVDEKTGQRRSDAPEVGVDKPDWRSGDLEAQANPDAMVHELGHLDIMPKGIGLEDSQRHMDQQYADVQREHGYMKQKQSQGEIQPMGVEQLLRRRMGLPANRSAVPVKSPDAPPRMAVDTNTLAGTRVAAGKDKQGNTKYADLIRQSRFVSPENRERVDKIDRGELRYDRKRGWVKPDVSSKQGLKENINSVINTRARELSKDPSRKDANTLMRSEDGEKESK